VTPVELIESVVLRDCGRGIELLAAYAQGDLARAALHLRSASSVVVATGVAVPTPQGPAAETDGPVGAAAVVSVLNSVGIHAAIVTDQLNASVCAASLSAYGLSDNLVQVVSQDGVPRKAAELWANGARTVLFIERLGPNTAHRYLSMGGVDLSTFTVPLDGLLTQPFYSIGIGDGGNEIGMGRIPHAVVAETIDRGDEIHCSTATDELVLAGVSNWGAWALVGAMAVQDHNFAGAATQALAVDRCETALERAVHAGAVDGVTKKNVESVDGFDRPIHSAVLVAVVALAGLS